MKKVILLLTAVFFVAIISSCSDDKSTSPDTEQGTGFPMAEGNWWKYDTEKSYISVDDNGVYSYNSPTVDEDGNVTPGSWWKIVDYKNSNWDIFTEIVNEEDEGYKLTGTNSMKGVRAGTTNVTYKGKSYTATKYLSIISTDLTTEILIDEEWTNERTMTSDTISYVLVGGIGFFSTETFNFMGMPVLGRNIDVLIDHNVK